MCGSRAPAADPGSRSWQTAQSPHATVPAGVGDPVPEVTKEQWLSAPVERRHPDRHTSGFNLHDSERLLFMNIKRTGVAIVAAMTLVLAAGCHPTTSDITWTLSQQGVRDTYCFDKQLTNGNTKVTCSGKYGGKTRKWTGYLYPQDSSYTYMFPTSGEFPNFYIRYFNGKVCSTKNLSRTGSGQGHQRVSHPLIATEHRRRTPPRSTTRVPTRG